VEFIRLAPDESRILGQLVSDPSSVTRLISLSVEVTSDCLRAFSCLKEAAIITEAYGGSVSEDQLKLLQRQE
jgi:hypothetical protein